MMVVSLSFLLSKKINGDGFVRAAFVSMILFFAIKVMMMVAVIVLILDYNLQYRSIGCLVVQFGSVVAVVVFIFH